MKHSKFLLPIAALFALTVTACNQGGGGASVKKYTVAFESNGGSQVASQTVESGKTATKPQDPFKAEYTFGGWYEDNEQFKVAFDFSTPIVKNITLYAKWTPAAKEYTVTFNSKGGSSVRKQVVKEGEKVSKPTDPSKAGYDFVAWYEEESYKTEYDFNKAVNKDFTLYAKWTLSVSPVLLSTITPDSVDTSDTEFTVWTSPNFVGHSAGGWASSDNTLNTSWRTILAVDKEGRVCFAVWCPANGYGVPKEYSYICHEYYSKDGVGYEGNPAIKPGPNFASNGADWELVVPSGGFIVTGHSNGANAIDSLVTGGKFNLYGGDDESLAASFNRSHCEFSTRSFFFRDGKVEAYDLATHLTHTGTKAGAFTGDATTQTYSKTIMMYEGDHLAFSFFDGVVDIDVTDTVMNVTGDYTSTRGGDGTYKMYVASDDTKNVFYAGARGKYQFDYNYSTNTFNITYIETNSFYLYLNNPLMDESEKMGVTYNEPFTLPTPSTPQGYTFSRWVDGNGQTVTSGTYSIKDDMTIFASFMKGGVEYAYTGKQAALSTSADSTFSVVDSNSGFIAHDGSGTSANGWAIGTTWNMSWRTFAVIDANGRVCYAVWCPANGFGGPTGYTYHCDPYYQASGVGYEGNPAIEVDPDYGPWGTYVGEKRAWELFTISIPAGGYLISTYEGGSSTLVSMLSAGAMVEASAELNAPHAWHTIIEVVNDVVYSRIEFPL